LKIGKLRANHVAPFVDAATRVIGVCRRE